MVCPRQIWAVSPILAVATMTTTLIAVGLWRGCRDLLGLLVHRDDDPLRYTANENTLSRLATTASRVKPASKQGLRPNGLAKNKVYILCARQGYRAGTCFFRISNPQIAFIYRLRHLLASKSSYGKRVCVGRSCRAVGSCVLSYPSPMSSSVGQLVGYRESPYSVAKHMRVSPIDESAPYFV